MSKQRAVSLCGCVAALPLLLGCSGGVGPSQAYGPPPDNGQPPSAQAYYSPPASAAPVAAAPAAFAGERIYTAGPAAPAAIVVLLPGAQVTPNPQLWAAEGIDVVAPPPSEIYQIMPDQEAAAARLIAAAQSMADAPIWLLGPDQAIEAAMSSLPPGTGQVSGVVMTSSSSGMRTCSERITYSYSGSGAPKVSVSKSGNACPPGPPSGEAPEIRVAPPTPAAQPYGPRVIEASLPAQPASPTVEKATVQQLADLIKSPPG